MRNGIASRFLTIARASQVVAVGSICGGIAALFWNNVYFCGSSLRQLIARQAPGCVPVSGTTCRLELGVPHCGSQLHTVWMAVSLVAFGVLVYWLARQTFSAVSRHPGSGAGTFLIWGIGLALVALAIVPAGNFAVSYSSWAPNGYPAGLVAHTRVTSYSAGLFALAALVSLTLSWTQLSRSRKH